MNDPKSFSHVETKYVRIRTDEHIKTVGNDVSEDDLYLYMKFRGTNSFGATILSEVEAVVYKELGIFCNRTNEVTEFYLIT